jgi:hypothetical protein
MHPLLNNFGSISVKWEAIIRDEFVTCGNDYKDIYNTVLYAISPDSFARF